MPIFVAISGKSFRLFTANARPPVISVKSASKDGPSCSSGVGPPSCVEKSDRVKLEIRFLHELANVRLAVPAMIIASVRYDEQRVLGVVCSFHLAQAQINSVQQRRLSMRRRKHHVILQFLHAAGKRTGQLGAVVEIHKKKFILRIRGAEKLHRRQARLFHLVRHAAAHVENHADGNRHVLAGEAHDFLLAVVLKDAEIFLLQAGDQPPVGVRHRDRNQGNVRLSLERFAFFDFLGVFRMRRALRLRPGERCGEESTTNQERHAKSRNDWTSGWLRCAVSQLGPHLCRGTRVALGSSAVRWRDSTTRVTQSKRRMCNFFVTSGPSARGRIQRRMHVKMPALAKGEQALCQIPTLRTSWW